MKHFSSNPIAMLTLVIVSCSFSGFEEKQLKISLAIALMSSSVIT